MLSGEIGSALEVRPNTMSTNLGVLVSAGLVRNRREGRTVRYFADFEALERLAGYFLHECCNGLLPSALSPAEARIPVQMNGDMSTR